MKTTIEETILDILLQAGYTEGDMVEYEKRIPEVFFKFIKWKDENVGLPNKQGKYLYWEDHFTLEELCNYWITYINE